MSEKLISNPSEIRLNEHDQVQTILGKPPGWILRWGITFIFLVVGVLIWISWMVKFPDIIPARVLLTTEIPPVHLFAQNEGKLASLLVEDKSKVSKNDLLAIIENPATYEDVMLLEDFLNQIKEKESKELAKIKYPTNLRLGEIQNTYSLFTQKIDDLSFFQNKKEIKSKVKAIKSQIRYLGRMNRSLRKQEGTVASAIELARKNQDRMELLQKDNAVSVKAVEDAKTEVLTKERELEKMQSDYLNNKMRIKDLELTIIDLEENQRDGKNEKSNSLKENIDNLLSAIAEWKLKNLVVSPMEGSVSFSMILNQNQFVKKGEEIMTIVPKGGVGTIIGNALLPAANSGKVKEGMVVNIRLDGYPYQEFGMVTATVKSKAAVPQNGNYLLEIEMPNQLVTTYGKDLSFQQEMEGLANIITEDRRILERIFDRFLSLIKNR